MKIAVVSPSFAAPGAFPAVHEQAMDRLADLGFEPVEYPTTRILGASPADRARDLTAAFADPSIGAILAVVGGDDQIQVIGFLDDEVIRSHPKPFLGYSDNTNLHNHLWQLSVPSFYGGSSQVHLGPGPGIDPEHRASLLAALRDGGHLEITPVAESEDVGVDWADPKALTSFGHRRAARPWLWHGPRRSVTGPTWGGCFEVIDQLAMAGRMPALDSLHGHVVLLEAAETLTPPDQIMRQSEPWANGDCSKLPPRSWWPHPRSAATTPYPPPTNRTPTGRPRPTSSSISSRTTTLTCPRCSASPSATPARSGSCPTEACSPSTRRLGGSSPTTKCPTTGPGSEWSRQRESNP